MSPGQKPLVEWRAIPTPLGPLTAAESVDGPLVIEFPARAARLRWADLLRRRHADLIIADGPCHQATAWLASYFNGTAAQPPYPAYLRDWLSPTEPQEAVWRALCQIPPGETRSYDDIARMTGLNPRLVGQLNGANHLAIYIPCHRVIGKNGSLVGYGGGLDRKRWLLDHELRSAGLVMTAG